MREGPSVSVAQQRIICSEVIGEEIKAALFEIDDNKAPGTDGFNVAFFKRTWIIVQSDVYQAVQEFFKYNMMLKAANNIVVTLVPKKAQPESIREFRPIACYSTIYKIISKIISERIKGALEDIIGPSQSAFIPVLLWQQEASLVT